MRAMVLAAGLGTRLRPLTGERPKALVELAGRTLLEITLTRLRDFGVREVIVNLHHFADQVVAYLKANRDFGMRIEVSREDGLLLGTGGGLKQAGWFFLEGAAAGEPFLLHNVDVLSAIDFGRLAAAHAQAGALATLAVQQRPTSRALLFDEQLRLCGRRAQGAPAEMACPCPRPLALAFSGIHVISPRLLQMWTEEGEFSIIDTYLRLARAGQGEKIQAFRADDYYWRDLGTRQSLAQAEHDLRSGLVR